MQRHEVINLLSGGRYKNYLEIGVDGGTTFNAVEIAHKVGVDPHFKIPESQLNGETYSTTSDDYFSKHAGRKFDCVFVDGLHTYEQSKRDFLNAWADLTPGGIIIIDDCDPADELASLPDLQKCREGRIAAGTPDNNTWMGDVYKTAIWINDCTTYSYAYVKESLGMVVVWPDEYKRRKKWFNSEDEIANCDFKTFKALPIPVVSIHDIARRVTRGKSLISMIEGWMRR